jgi:hypothetical protein
VNPLLLLLPSSPSRGYLGKRVISFGRVASSCCPLALHLCGYLGKRVISLLGDPHAALNGLSAFLESSGHNPSHTRPSPLDNSNAGPPATQLQMRERKPQRAPKSSINQASPAALPLHPHLHRGPQIQKIIPRNGEPGLATTH